MTAPAQLQRMPGPHAAPLGTLRVAGRLAADAVMAPLTGKPPGALLMLHIAPDHGLHYLARVPLGTDAADHLQAEALLPLLRKGAAVSVAADALELQTDHGHAALRLVNPHTVVLFERPRSPVGGTPQ